MAARFDASRAAELDQQRGDGTPIMLTIPTDEPWVPLRILGLGLDSSQTVEADVFLLTPERPQLLSGGSGLSLERSEPASASLLADLRSDKGMGWVPRDLWLSYLTLDTLAGDLDYDLAISTHEGSEPSAIAAGIFGATDARDLTRDELAWPIGVGVVAVGAGVTACVLGGRWVRRRALERSA
jgi:hypothetical protein